MWNPFKKKDTKVQDYLQAAKDLINTAEARFKKDKNKHHLKENGLEWFTNYIYEGLQPETKALVNKETLLQIIVLLAKVYISSK